MVLMSKLWGISFSSINSFKWSLLFSTLNGFSFKAFFLLITYIIFPISSFLLIIILYYEPNTIKRPLLESNLLRLQHIRTVANILTRGDQIILISYLSPNKKFCVTKLGELSLSWAVHSTKTLLKSNYQWTLISTRTTKISYIVRQTTVCAHITCNICTVILWYTIACLTIMCESLSLCLPYGLC